MGLLVKGFKLGLLVVLAWMINVALGYEVKVDSLILLSITVAWMKASRVGAWLFGALIVISMFYIPISWNYAHPNLTIVSSLIETNSSEALEFFQDLEIMTLAVAVVFASISLMLFKFIPRIQGVKTTLFGLVLFSFLLLDKPVRTIIDRDIEDNYTQALISNMRYAPVRFFYDWYDSYEKYHQYNAHIMAQKEKSSSLLITKKPQQAKNTIFVIGESVRKDYLNAYGFPLNNTPFMSSANGQLWTQFLSPGPNTFTSVMRLITLNDGINIELNNNINTLAESAGVETFWISNQGRMGEFDTGISSIANYANHVSFTRSGSYRDSNIHDSTLLPSIQEALVSSHNSKLIVVHLIGSHPRFCERIEDEVDFDFNGDKISCYIESIKQTDTLLSNIDQMAQKQKLPYDLLYVSDHGLGHRDNGQNLRHDSAVKQAYEVPLFVTGSSFKSREIVQSTRNGFVLIKAISELMNVSSQRLDSLPSFFSSYEEAPMVNNGEGKLIGLDELRNDPIQL